MEYAAPSPLPAARPTRVRYGVLAFAASLSMLTYLDRVCISSGQSNIIHDLGLQSEADLKWVFALFTLAYSIFEVPTGWLGDVIGPRKVLIRIVLWWSFFTAVTGVIGMNVGGFVLGGLTTLAIVRFLFGMGEAGAYPNITRALHNWFPLHERGLAQGTVWMSARLMGGLTPLVWALLVEGLHWPGSSSGTAFGGWLHWRSTFWLFGALGVVWCLFFAAWFRDRPEKKASVNAAELALIRASAAESEAGHAQVPWLKLITSGNLWALCIMYFCQAYGWYFYITYLPRFLEDQYGVAKTSVLGAIYKGGPLWMGAVGCLVGGFITDWLVRRLGRRLGRKTIGAFGHAACMACFLLCPYMPTALTFFLAISFAGFSADLTMGSSWATCQDIGRRYAAIVAGFMNMVGNFGGFVAIVISGFVLDYGKAVHAARLGTTSQLLVGSDLTAGLMIGYQINFLVFAAVYVIGVICWLCIDASKPVAGE
jgi:ACS family glucarate transporter-like MFS transporter